MATLIDVRDALALQGRLEASQLSKQLSTPLPMIMAILLRLEAMGKVVRLTEEDNSCLSGSCKGCPERQGCSREIWSLR